MNFLGCFPTSVWVWQCRYCLKGYLCFVTFSFSVKSTKLNNCRLLTPKKKFRLQQFTVNQVWCLITYPPRLVQNLHSDVNTICHSFWRLNPEDIGYILANGLQFSVCWSHSGWYSFSTAWLRFCMCRYALVTNRPLCSGSIVRERKLNR